MAPKRKAEDDALSSRQKAARTTTSKNNKTTTIDYGTIATRSDAAPATEQAKRSGRKLGYWALAMKQKANDKLADEVEDQRNIARAATADQALVGEAPLLPPSRETKAGLSRFEQLPTEILNRVLSFSQQHVTDKH